MLEQRTLSKFLPQNFDDFERYIAPSFYSPPIEDKHSLEYQLKRFKILQGAKRSWLDLHVELHMFTMKKYDEQYLGELTQFQRDCANSAPTDGTTLFPLVQTYIQHRTDRIKEEIFLQMSYFRVNLAQRRQRATSAKGTVGVSSEAILNADHHSLTDTEREYLARSEIYIQRIFFFSQTFS